MFLKSTIRNISKICCYSNFSKAQTPLIANGILTSSPALINKEFNNLNISNGQNKSSKIINPFTNKIDILNQVVFDLELPSLIETFAELPSNQTTEKPQDSNKKPIQIGGFKENATIYAHKSHVYWRKRRMRRHRLVRWRKKHPSIVEGRREKKLRVRKQKHIQDLRKCYQQFGLRRMPPMLEKDRIEELKREYSESGMLVDVIPREDMMRIARINSICHLTDYEEKMKKRNSRATKRRRE